MSTLAPTMASTLAVRGARHGQGVPACVPACVPASGGARLVVLPLWGGLPKTRTSCRSCWRLRIYGAAFSGRDGAAGGGGAGGGADGGLGKVQGHGRLHEAVDGSVGLEDADHSTGKRM